MYQSLIQPEYHHELGKSVSVHMSTSISGYMTRNTTTNNFINAQVFISYSIFGT